jgi:Uma2 family endonuclease
VAQQATLSPLTRGEWFPMTYEEFLAWAPDGLRTEWTDGEGIIHVSTGDRHQWTIAVFAMLLSEFVRPFGLGRVVTAPYPAKLWPDGPHREPDVMFVSASRLSSWTHQRFHGAPDFATEVLSEETAGEDRGRKRREFETAGVREYLMLEGRPGRDDFEFLRMDAVGRLQPVAPDDQGRYHSKVSSGFWFHPDWFRQDPLPNPMTILRRISPEAWRRLVAEVEADE